MAKKLFFFAPAAGYTVYRNNYIIIKPRGQVWISAKSGFGEKMLVKSGLFTISCPVVPCKVRFVEETTCKVGTFLPQSWVLEKQRSGSTFSRTLGFQDSETQLCFKFQTLHTITVPILISRSTKAHGWWPQVNNSCPMHYWIKWFWIAKSGVF